MKFLAQGSQKLEPEQDKQTHIQTDATEHITIQHL